MVAARRNAAGWWQAVLGLLALTALVATAPLPAPAFEADGSSIERAIPIQAASTAEGIAAENAYIRQRYPGWRKVRQALIRRGGRAYDRITIVSPSGERRDIFFDITSFFGRL